MSPRLCAALLVVVAAITCTSHPRVSDTLGARGDSPHAIPPYSGLPLPVADSVLRYVEGLVRRSIGDVVRMQPPTVALNPLDRSIVRTLETLPQDTLAAALLTLASDHEPKGSATPLQGSAVFFYVMMRLPEEPLLTLFLSSDAPEVAREGVARALGWRERFMPEPDPTRLRFVRALGEQVQQHRLRHASDLALWSFVVDMLRLEASVGQTGSAQILADSVVIRALSATPAH